MTARSDGATMSAPSGHEPLAAATTPKVVGVDGIRAAL